MKKNTTSDDFFKKTGFRISDAENMRFGIGNFVSRFIDTLSPKWYDYAKYCYGIGKVPQDKNNWVKNRCRFYFIEKFGAEGDLFYEIMNEHENRD